VTEPATQPPKQSQLSEGTAAANGLKRIFRTKSPHDLVDEANTADRLMKKTLTAWDLVAFGIGATIGSGIFALTGTAAAGHGSAAPADWMSTPILNLIMGGPLGRDGAGPALVISFIIAAIACGLTALCYAELAAMIPVSGSAYTFAYAALGEVVAWIIGWDLILEYAVGNIAVAVSWSDYFLQFLHGMTGLKIPLWLSTDAGTAAARLTLPVDSPIRELYSSMTLPQVFGHNFAMNVPAFVIVALITWLLVVGIQESAKLNLWMVFIKTTICLFFIAYGAFYVNPHNWVPFAPTGLVGIMGGAAIVFFAFIGFDAVSSTAEETKNPQRDMPIGMIGSLVACTILYVLVSIVLTGIMPYQTYANDAAPVATALAYTKPPWGSGVWPQMLVSAGAVAGMTSVLLVFQLGQPRIFMAMSRDGLLPPFFAKLHPKFRTPFIPTILTGLFVGITAMFIDIGQAAELCNIGTLSAFILVCGGVLVLRKTHADTFRPFKCPWSPTLPILGIISCFILMLSLPVKTWERFFIWMAVGMVIYFGYGLRQRPLEKNPPAPPTNP
jgi:APA family basic amino acid/polyamine antiporter